MKTLILVFLSVLLGKVTDLYIWNIPLEFSGPVSTLIDFTVFISFLGLFTILVILTLRMKKTIKIVLLSIEIPIIITSFIIFLFYLTISDTGNWTDIHNTLTSLDNKNERIVLQMRSGLAYQKTELRERYIYKVNDFVRYSKDFDSIKLNGTYVYDGFKINNIDTVRYVNHIYKSAYKRKE